MSDPHERVIRASEVGQYLYCSRAWWLGSVLGLASANRAELAAGISAHRAHGRRVRAASGLTRLAYLLLALALLAAAIGLWQLLGA